MPYLSVLSDPQAGHGFATGASLTASLAALPASASVLEWDVEMRDGKMVVLVRPTEASPK